MANEILNEMQRSRGGDVIHEDQSRYQVKLKSPEGGEGWTGEVIGFPELIPLKTVSVLIADKTMMVFDKAYKKLWQTTLNYPVSGWMGALEGENAPYGMGPLVERKDTLYVFDQGVLAAFDLATGNVRWRYPSVGIAGLFFDDKGMVYVNTTSAGPDNLRHPREIDITRKDSAVVVKLDPRNGKVLWTAEPGGLVNYASGKFLYTVVSYMPEEPDEDDPYHEDPPPPYLRIKRIDPRTGRVKWEHFEQRAPVDIQFDKNTIRMVFKKEVEVLRFLAL
jgi:outer membrane protein assembly factor BamB